MKRRLKYLKKQNQVYSIIPIPIVTILGIGIMTFFTIHKEPYWTYNWTEIRKSIKDSLIVVDKRGVIAVGKEPIDLENNEVIRRKWIMSNATDLELLKLTENPSTTIRAIAYEGLLRKTNFKGKDKLIIKAIKDTIAPLFLDSKYSTIDTNIGEYFAIYLLGIDKKIPPPPILPNFGLSTLEKENIITEYRKICND